VLHLDLPLANVNIHTGTLWRKFWSPPSPNLGTVGSETRMGGGGKDSKEQFKAGVSAIAAPGLEWNSSGDRDHPILREVSAGLGGPPYEHNAPNSHIRKYINVSVRVSRQIPRRDLAVRAAGGDAVCLV